LLEIEKEREKLKTEKQMFLKEIENERALVQVEKR
jgi:hypothetical protein